MLSAACQNDLRQWEGPCRGLQTKCLLRGHFHCFVGIIITALACQKLKLVGVMLGPRGLWSGVVWCLVRTSPEMHSTYGGCNQFCAVEARGRGPTKRGSHVAGAARFDGCAVIYFI